MNGLIGYTGFVGSNLVNQANFDKLYNTKNISEIRGCKFDTLVCAGVSAVKWWANKHPEDDWKAISDLLDNLQQVQADKLILISTVDVYPCPTGVTEHSCTSDFGGNFYGAHRLIFEQEVRNIFNNTTIIRLPALFGPNLKKNVLYDLLCKNLLNKISLESSFQWYPIIRLWTDIEKALLTEHEVMNFVTEPINTREIWSRWFSYLEVGLDSTSIANYDIRTEYAHVFGRNDGYIMGKNEIITELGEWLASPGVYCV